MRYPGTATTLALAVLTVSTVGACSGSNDDAADTGSSSAHASHTSAGTATSSSSETMSPGTSGHMMDGGPAPAGIKAANNPRFPVGSNVIVTADHMPGMKNARAKVVGAYRTHVYAISYTPTNGRARVSGHKWVVQQELSGVGAKRLADGATATITADHMPGMKGARATIDSSTDQTVYMIDYGVDGMTMKNHKWVVDSELKPAG